METKMKKPAMTVGELRKLLEAFDDNQKLVFSDVRFGDFDLVGAVGAALSEDNWENDIRPILRLEKRVDR